ncbi:MAG: hypothetical protein ACK53K_09760 [Burkholderiales bacterium]
MATPNNQHGAGHKHAINAYHWAAAEVAGYAGAWMRDLSKPVGMARKQREVGTRYVT